MIDQQTELSYVALHAKGELKERALRLRQHLAGCDICPRRCGVNRLMGETGYCRSGPGMEIASYCDHHGEEPVISGTRGSGTVFLANCNLRCCFCQNYQISQQWPRQKNETGTRELAGIMLKLQHAGCQNINLVSPTHFVPQLVEAIDLAAGEGLKLPLVYNTNSYDSVDVLKELEGIIGIYLPDIKYADNEKARLYSRAIGYVEASRKAIKEMYRQVGDLVLDRQGLAWRGVIVRHLVLPGDISGTRQCLEWLAAEVSTGVGLSLMSQYHPSFKATEYPELKQTLKPREYAEALKVARQLGFRRVFAQGQQAPLLYLPDFARQKPFGA